LFHIKYHLKISAKNGKKTRVTTSLSVTIFLILRISMRKERKYDVDCSFSDFLIRNLVLFGVIAINMSDSLKMS